MIFRSKKRGFTLVEMLIAVSLFVIIAFFSIGSILSIFDANRRAQSSKTVVDNLNLAVENMARTIRFGSNYHCGVTGSLSTPTNCADNSYGNGDTAMAVTFEGEIVVYRLCGTAIFRFEGGNGSCNDPRFAITSPETVIEYFRFYVFGTTVGDNYQPYVLAVIKGYSGNKPTSQSKFVIETIMSQRTLDI